VSKKNRRIQKKQQVFLLVAVFCVIIRKHNANIFPKEPARPLASHHSITDGVPPPYATDED
jgi:hypothetical protein